MVYKIEKGIKIPKRCSYPFKNMNVDDSFYVKIINIDMNCDRVMRKIYAASKWYKYKTQTKGFKISIKRDDKGIRMWRVS